MQNTVVQAAGVWASACFICSLVGLAKHHTALRGNLVGAIGMLLAVCSLLIGADHSTIMYGLGAIALGGIVGLIAAGRVKMTQMPELIALLHSFVGLAAVLVALNSYLDPMVPSGSMSSIVLVEILVGAFIGALTCSGSLVAYGKLSGHLSGAAWKCPNGQLLNVLGVAICLGLTIFAAAVPHGSHLVSLLLIIAIAVGIGLQLVGAIGGADMPIVVSMLNSYSGWAAAASGFILSHHVLIITGALVGSSGAILSAMMCRAMNRSFSRVVFARGNPSQAESLSVEIGDTNNASDRLTYQTTSVAAVVEQLKSSKFILITPGYGMAVSQAQHALAMLAKHLQAAKKRVEFAVHPVAGRLPGHMNVLLAEAGVPYESVYEMEEVNPYIHEADLVLVIGANDTVNPAAEEDPASPIAGMPVLKVWKAKQVVVFKRSMTSGYAGVENPLFLRKNTKMLFGDAKGSVEAILREWM